MGDDACVEAIRWTDRCGVLPGLLHVTGTVTAPIPFGVARMVGCRGGQGQSLDVVAVMVRLGDSTGDRLAVVVGFRGQMNGLLIPQEGHHFGLRNDHVVGHRYGLQIGVEEVARRYVVRIDVGEGAHRFVVRIDVGVRLHPVLPKDVFADDPRDRYETRKVLALDDLGDRFHPNPCGL